MQFTPIFSVSQLRLIQLQSNTLTVHCRMAGILPLLILLHCDQRGRLSRARVETIQEEMAVFQLAQFSYPEAKFFQGFSPRLIGVPRNGFYYSHAPPIMLLHEQLARFSQKPNFISWLTKPQCLWRKLCQMFKSLTAQICKIPHTLCNKLQSKMLEYHPILYRFSFWAWVLDLGKVKNIKQVCYCQAAGLLFLWNFCTLCINT